MWTLRIPSRAYAWFSVYAVLSFSIHDILWETVNSDRGLPWGALREIPVISWRDPSRDVLFPNGSHSLEKNSIEAGAMSSWSVQ